MAIMLEEAMFQDSMRETRKRSYSPFKRVTLLGSFFDTRIVVYILQ